MDQDNKFYSSHNKILEVEHLSHDPRFPFTYATPSTLDMYETLPNLSPSSYSPTQSHLHLSSTHNASLSTANFKRKWSTMSPNNTPKTPQHLNTAHHLLNTPQQFLNTTSLPPLNSAPSPNTPLNSSINNSHPSLSNIHNLYSGNPQIPINPTQTPSNNLQHHANNFSLPHSTTPPYSLPQLEHSSSSAPGLSYKNTEAHAPASNYTYTSSVHAYTPPHSTLSALHNTYIPPQIIPSSQLTHFKTENLGVATLPPTLHYTSSHGSFQSQQQIHVPIHPQTINAQSHERSTGGNISNSYQSIMGNQSNSVSNTSRTLFKNEDNFHQSLPMNIYQTHNSQQINIQSDNKIYNTNPPQQPQTPFIFHTEQQQLQTQPPRSEPYSIQYPLQPDTHMIPQTFITDANSIQQAISSDQHPVQHILNSDSHSIHNPLQTQGTPLQETLHTDLLSLEQTSEPFDNYFDPSELSEHDISSTNKTPSESPISFFHSKSNASSTESRSSSPLSEQTTETSKHNSKLLSIASILRIIKRALPENAKVTKESKKFIQESVREFIETITIQATARCSEEKRKTINGNDILWALEQKGLTNYHSFLHDYLEQLRKEKRSNLLENTPTSGDINSVNESNTYTKTDTTTHMPEQFTTTGPNYIVESGYNDGIPLNYHSLFPLTHASYDNHQLRNFHNGGRPIPQLFRNIPVITSNHPQMQSSILVPHTISGGNPLGSSNDIQNMNTSNNQIKGLTIPQVSGIPVMSGPPHLMPSITHSVQHIPISNNLIAPNSTTGLGVAGYHPIQHTPNHIPSYANLSHMAQSQHIEGNQLTPGGHYTQFHVLPQQYYPQKFEDRANIMPGHPSMQHFYINNPHQPKFALIGPSLPPSHPSSAFTGYHLLPNSLHSTHSVNPNVPFNSNLNTNNLDGPMKTETFTNAYMQPHNEISGENSN